MLTSITKPFHYPLQNLILCHFWWNHSIQLSHFAICSSSDRAFCLAQGIRQLQTPCEMRPNTEFFRVRIFQHLDRIRRDTKYLFIFSPNAGNYGPEKTPYLDTFHAVKITQRRPILQYSFSHFPLNLEIQLLAFIVCSNDINNSTTFFHQKLYF